MNLAEAADLALSHARATTTNLEVVGAEGETLEVGVRLGEIEKLKRARERRIAVRAFVGRSSAVCSTADLSAESLRRLVDDCRGLATVTAPDPFAALADPEEPGVSIPDLELCDPSSRSVAAEDAIAVATQAERAALNADPVVTNSEGAEFQASHQRLICRSSRGIATEYATSSFSLAVVPVASRNGQMQQDYWYTAARHRVDLEPAEEVGKTAAARAIRRLDARRVQSCEVPVIFDPETAASLLGHVIAAASGSSVYRGTSFLESRIGTKVARSGICLIDDPLMPRCLGSRPFDAEGLRTRRNVVVQDGVLRTFLLDTYSARKLGMAGTASAVRALGDVPSAGPSNFFLENGAFPVEDIIASVDSGLYVTELSGFGVNPVTGDYSRGAAGLWIEKGRLSFPVEEITIAGNLLDMLQAIEMVGNDLRFRSSIAAPTLKIARLMVAGET